MNEYLYFTFSTLLLKLFVQFCSGFVFIIPTVGRNIIPTAGRKCKQPFSVYCRGKRFVQLCSGFVFIIHAVGSKCKQPFIV